jgi:hypothetical protein
MTGSVVTTTAGTFGDGLRGTALVIPVLVAPDLFRGSPGSMSPVAPTPGLADTGTSPGATTGVEAKIDR